MRIVIIGSTGTVRQNEITRDELDLSQCDLPQNFWAFQWNEFGNDRGHIEYNSPLIQNDEVTQLPEWVNKCIEVLNNKLNQEIVEQEAARIAAEQAASQIAAEQASTEPSTQNESNA